MRLPQGGSKTVLAPAEVASLTLSPRARGAAAKTPFEKGERRVLSKRRSRSQLNAAPLRKGDRPCDGGTEADPG
jgi:hypothetical protein